MEDAAWVFDSLVGFLHGPVWNAPLQTFIEEKSLTFEPTENGEVANKEEYTVIHEEYKHLVDLMLGSFMEDIGITPGQFEAACHMSQQGGGGLPLHFHQRLFEQIWAANDYSIFARMMTQRNVELQIQALELIEQRSGAVPRSYQHDAESKTEDDDHDAVIMEQVKKLSLEEMDHGEPVKQEEAVEEPPIEEIHKEKQSLMSALDQFQQRVVAKEKTQISAPSGDRPEQSQAMSLPRIKTPLKNIEAASEMKPLLEDKEQRQQYLKQQRDKLLALKKQIREKQLADSTGDSSALPGRPKSARNAKLLLSGDPVVAQESSLQLRKALADRLRSEVVDKS